MFNSKEKIENSFLIDDINDLIQIHLDVIDGYQHASEHIRDANLQRHLQDWIKRHEQDIESLSELSRSNGGEVRSKPDLAVLATRARLVVARVFDGAAQADALRREEERLLLEYERALNSLAELPGMEAVLQSNYRDTQARIEQLRAVGA